MRLIDADALENEVDTWGCNDYDKFDFLEAINKAPTIEERPKGKWKCFIGSAFYGLDEDYEPIWRDRKIYHCSKCNRRTIIKEKFCPECGAEMEADND